MDTLHLEGCQQKNPGMNFTQNFRNFMVESLLTGRLLLDKIAGELRQLRAPDLASGLVAIPELVPLILAHLDDAKKFVSVLDPLGRGGPPKLPARGKSLAMTGARLVDQVAATARPAGSTHSHFPSTSATVDTREPHHGVASGSVAGSHRAAHAIN